MRDQENKTSMKWAFFFEKKDKWKMKNKTRDEKGDITANIET